ncbi:MAG: hypothetical protein CFK52_07030 [Chloracidobacterium sp. CP2_5A]|nr:MAG: hypothetical protein CFK52_07030 [Chloracidobacterium sp. CP2_5A]
MDLYYGVYGLRLAATVRIPFLRELPDTLGLPDIAVSFEEGKPLATVQEDKPWYQAPSAPGEGPELVAYREPETRRVRFRYAGGTVFDYDLGNGRLTACWLLPQTFEDACTYLVGPILGFALQMRHRACLHASVAAIGDSAVAFVGPNGSGKSTLAAALLRRGARIVTEDVAAIERRAGGICAHYGPRAIRLWSPSVTALYGYPNALPQISKHWGKQYLTLDERDNEWEQGASLRAIYLLEVSGSNAPVACEPLAPAAAVGKLMANIYPGWLPIPEARVAILDTLIDLVAALPVARLSLPSRFARLNDVCDYLLARHA